MNGFIYKITNKVNNKVYIGQTKYTVESRWRQHLKNFNIEHRQQPLYLAFAKYGLDNFYVETLEEVSIDKLDEREIYWIAYYDSFKKGYNATLGGASSKIQYWTDDKYEEIRTLYLSGFSCKKIADLFNVSRWTIEHILKSLNIKLRKHPLDFNAKETEDFIKDYKTGFSLTELAKRYNTDRETVRRFLVNHNVDLKEHSLILKNEDLQQEMIDDFLTGISYKDLEKKYHSDSRTLQKILSRHNINLDIKRSILNKRKGQHLLSDEECLKLIDMYRSKEFTVTHIAHKFNINESTVYSTLDRFGLRCRRYNLSKSVQSLKE